MTKEIYQRFRDWYYRDNGPISIMEPCKFAYNQGAIEERLALSKKISECVTYEEIMLLIRMEVEELERKGE